ncbi:MAG: protein kinase [Candidatus Obscuribacterales bacterium]|nr:protein kinase [Candidatus Obscuribacterales bacterium]
MIQETQFPESLSTRYENARLIGSGATSRVFAAFDKHLLKDVAIKILSPQASSQTVLRFQQEAKVISRLKHPNIVGALDFALNDEVQPYMVMELLGDETLSTLIRRNRKIGLRNLLGIFIQVCSAMSYAHSQGVLHRDLKPGNVLIEYVDGSVLKAKVADFGVAKITGTPFLATTGNIIIGTPAYMSPEQFLHRQVDVRSDIYSFGCVMFEALEGRLPYLAENLSELALCHANDPIPVLQGSGAAPIPASLKELVYRCLAKQPEDRFESFSQVEEVLKEIRGPEVDVAPVQAKHSARNESEAVSQNFVKLHMQASTKIKVFIAVTAALILFVGIRIGLNLLTTLEPRSSAEPVEFIISEPTSLPRAGLGVRLPSGGGERRFLLPESSRRGTDAELLAKAQSDYDKGQFLRAEEYLKTILDRSPEDFNALVLRSATRSELGIWSGALVDIISAIKLRPSQTQLLYKSAELRRATGDFNGALDDMSELVQKYPNDPKAVLGRAQLYELTKIFEEALQDYTRACQLNSGDQAAWIGKGRIFREMAEYDKAIEALTKAISIGGNCAEAFYLRGNSYSAIGNYQEAIEDFNTAIELNGEDSSYYRGRADALRKNGQEPLARLDELRAKSKGNVIK